MDPTVALIVASTRAVTDVVAMGKVVEEEPAGTVTVAGTVAADALDVRLTATPHVGAGPLSVTVPVAGWPPVTREGDTERLTNAGEVTVKYAVRITAPAVAVIVTPVEDTIPVV